MAKVDGFVMVEHIVVKNIDDFLNYILDGFMNIGFTTDWCEAYAMIDSYAREKGLDYEVD